MKRSGMIFGMTFGMAALLMAEETGGDVPAGGGEERVEPKASTTKLGTEKAPEQQEAPAERPGDAEVLDKAGFAHSEDQGLNYSLAFLARNGFDAANPAVDAAMGGDFSLLKAELAAKGIPGWEQALGLGEQAYGRAVESQKAKQAEVGKVVLSIAEESGVDWEEAVAHIGKSASDAEKSTLNSLMADPATARIAAAFITGQFLQTGTSERDPVAAVGTGAAPANQGQGGQITRREYTEKMRELRGKMGDDYINSPEAQALYKRLG